MKRNLFAALAISAMAAAGVPATAGASTTAGTTILNVVTVDYKDASNTTSFSAAFSTTVTVNLVQSGLNVTSAPNSTTMPGFNCLGTGSYASGGTFSAYYSLTATANGKDRYNLSITNTGYNASSSSAAYAILKADGSVQAAATTGASSLELNSAIVVGTVGDNTLLFPGGSLKKEADGGFASGDVVVVDYGATKTAYLVDTVTLGHAASYTISGATASTTSGDKTDEVRDAITVKPFDNNILGIGSGTSGAIPKFNSSAPPVGTVVGEMAIVRIDVVAKSNTKGTDATVDYQLAITDSSNNNPTYVGTGAANTCPAGNFLATKLEILKQVMNVTKGGGYGPTATSDPGDILEYLVTVTNNGGQATSAAVIDNVPTYTQLLAFDNNYGSGTVNNTSGVFAEINDGVNTVKLTVDASGEIAAQPTPPAPNVGFGKAAGVTAGAALNFYLGQGSSASAGGTVPSCSDSTKNTQALCPPLNWNRTYTIKYRVKVD